MFKLGNMLKAKSNFKIHQNFQMLHWFTFRLFAMDDPVVCTTPVRHVESPPEMAYT